MLEKLPVSANDNFDKKVRVEMARAAAADGPWEAWETYRAQIHDLDVRRRLKKELADIKNILNAADEESAKLLALHQSEMTRNEETIAYLEKCFSAIEDMRVEAEAIERMLGPGGKLDEKFARAFLERFGDAMGMAYQAAS